MFLVQAVEQRLDGMPVAVVEEGSRGRGQTIVGGAGVWIFNGKRNEQAWWWLFPGSLWPPR